MQPLRLEIFAEDDDPVAEAESQAPGAVPEADYETGFQAGWEAAEAARDQTAELQAAEAARALQALEFTFHDARGHVLRALAPLFQELANRFLPMIARESLPHLITDALLPLAEEASETPVELLLHPSMREAIARHLAEFPSLPVVLIEQTDQPRERVSLRLGARETRIDVEAALQTVKQLLHTYFDPPAQDARHG